MQTEMYYFAVFCVWYVTITSHTCVPDRPSLHVTLTKSLIDLSFPGGHFWARKNEEQHGEAGRQFSSRVLVSRIETLQPSGATRQARDLVAIRFRVGSEDKTKWKIRHFVLSGESRAIGIGKGHRIAPRLHSVHVIRGPRTEITRSCCDCRVRLSREKTGWRGKQHAARHRTRNWLRQPTPAYLWHLYEYNGYPDMMNLCMKLHGSVRWMKTFICRTESLHGSREDGRIKLDIYEILGIMVI